MHVRDITFHTKFTSQKLSQKNNHILLIRCYNFVASLLAAPYFEFEFLATSRAVRNEY